MELLGDPLSLVNKVSDSVLQFFRRTGVSDSPHICTSYDIYIRTMK
jgi:hypothetical protein